MTMLVSGSSACWQQQDVPTSVANDFADLAKWLPLSRLLITYVAGPYPDAEQCRRQSK